MNWVNFWVLIVLASSLEGLVRCERPAVVNIGAVLSYDSVIGRVAKVAIETAVGDVNADGSVLGGTKLNLIMEDSNCSSFLGSVGAFKALEKEAVVIIGPQSSTTAHMISSISNGLQIPLVSFAATDPTLSARQYPFFIRMTQTDSYQMTAMAHLLGYYGWRRIIAIFVDNEYGRNGIYYLKDKIAEKMSVVYEIMLPIGTSREHMLHVLQNSKNIGPRVYVVHTSPDSGLEILSAARQLDMMTDEYVWLATDWLCTTLDSSETVANNSLSYLQGLVGFCQYVPESNQKSAFVSKWSELRRKGVVTSMLNLYGFYAYDTVWAVAHAINDFLSDSGNLTFTSSYNLVNMKGKMQLNKLKTFNGGHMLLQKLLFLNFRGVIGQIQFDRDHNLNTGTYRIINIDGKAIRTVGYWGDHSGLSFSLPNTSYGKDQRNSSAKHVLGNITWPGGKLETPRGWVVATNDKPLLIGVPNRVTYPNFASATEDKHSAKGYCIDVFEAAIKLLPYEVPHRFVPFGDGVSHPDYWGILSLVSDQVLDGAVGDFVINRNRTKIVDFTQPYLYSGLVIVVPMRSIKSSAWAFLRPFSVNMWCATGAFFFLIGVVIWLFEHRVNKDFRGPPKRQFVTLLLFSFSSLFHSQKEDTLSTLGKFVLVVWYFLLLVITSNYTASLTSFFTVQQLLSPIDGIDSLVSSKDPIGYRNGSYIRLFMIDNFKIKPSRLVPLGSASEEFAEALRLGPKNGGVAAVVDEIPFVDLFLQNTSGFGVVGQPFSLSGWGFAFPKGFPLLVDLSSALVKLSDSGGLQKIHEKWFCRTGCTNWRASSSDPNRLQLRVFWGLFLVCGIAIIISLVLFFLRAIRQFIHFNKHHRDRGEISDKGCYQSIYGFFDFFDEKEEAIKYMFKKQQNNTSQPQQVIVIVISRGLERLERHHFILFPCQV